MRKPEKRRLLGKAKYARKIERGGELIEKKD